MAEQKPEVKYETEGPSGRQCRDCKFFETAEDSTKGKCFGNDVLAQGTCNMFAAG
jgi:hypothetical protein